MLKAVILIRYRSAKARLDVHSKGPRTNPEPALSEVMSGFRAQSCFSYNRQLCPNRTS